MGTITRFPHKRINTELLLVKYEDVMICSFVNVRSGEKWTFTNRVIFLGPLNLLDSFTTRPTSPQYNRYRRLKGEEFLKKKYILFITTTWGRI